MLANVGFFKIIVGKTMINVGFLKAEVEQSAYDYAAYVMNPEH